MTDKRTPSNGTDPRWALLRERWQCASCGQSHSGVFDLACAKPDPWPGSEALSPNSAVSTSTHFLSEDFCVLDGEHYFVRCVLQLPLIGAGQSFAFGVWSTLSKANFARYVETFDSGAQEGLGPWFGWFSNRLKGYPDTFALKCQVHPQSVRQRPRIELEPSDHLLMLESREGIDFDRLVSIYAANGHQVIAH